MYSATFIFKRCAFIFKPMASVWLIVWAFYARRCKTFSLVLLQICVGSRCYFKQSVCSFPRDNLQFHFESQGYFHIKKGLKDNKLRFSTEENYIKFEKDCRDVAGSETKEEFEHMVHLLAAKWRSREGDAVKWFLKEWCSEQYGTWYSGFTRAGLPNTNNSVERFNSALKRYVTKRRRLSLNKLLPACEDELMYHSIESGKRAFYSQPHFDRPKWIEAQIWATSIRGMVIETKAPAKGCFFVPSTTYLESLNSLPTVQVLRDASNNYRQTAEPLHGENFGAFVQRRRSFWKLVTNTSPVLPEDCFTCNCPPYLQYATCKHALGLGLHYKKLVAPPQWKGNKVEDLKRKGRPKKVGYCLSKK